MPKTKTKVSSDKLVMTAQLTVPSLSLCKLYSTYRPGAQLRQHSISWVGHTALRYLPHSQQRTLHDNTHICTLISLISMAHVKQVRIQDLCKGGAKRDFADIAQQSCGGGKILGLKIRGQHLDLLCFNFLRFFPFSSFFPFQNFTAFHLFPYFFQLYQKIHSKNNLKLDYNWIQF